MRANARSNLCVRSHVPDPPESTLTAIRKGLLSLMLAEQAALNRLTQKLAEADSPPQPLPQPTP